MTTKLQKWGNSLALRVPAALAKDLALGDGSAVTLRIEGGCLVVAPVAAVRLADLVAEITPGNRHAEVATGQPVGREVW